MLAEFVYISNFTEGLVVPIPTFCDASTVTAVVPAVLMFNMPVLSAVDISPPAPLVEASILEAIYFSYNTTQRCPLGTVTVAPEAIVTGPTDKPFLFVANV